MSDPRIETFVGKRIDPLALKVEDVSTEDMVHSLANKCRFNGFCARFYSVAEHSVNCLRYAEKLLGARGEEALAVLLHDASEYPLFDIPRPIKQSGQLKELVFSQDRAQAVIHEAFGLPYPLPAEIGWTVHEADKFMLWLEADILLPSQGSWWTDIPKIEISDEDRNKFISKSVVHPPDAEEAFQEELLDLMGTVDRMWP